MDKPGFPSTLLEILETGLSWKINIEKNKYRLHYLKDNVEALHVYSAEDLDIIDDRIVKTLQKAVQWVCKDAIQKTLVSSFNLWQSEQHILKRNNKDYYLYMVKAADLAPDGRVKLSYIYHALYGIVDGLPVAKGHMVGAIDVELPLAAVEAAYPGFEKAFNIAHAMGLTKFDAGKFCMDHLSKKHNAQAMPEITIPQAFDTR